MIGNSSLLAAVLTVVSVVSLSALCALCLRCRKKSKIIHEEHQIYDPQTFQRGGSRFAVTRSKTVTRANQIDSATAEMPEEFEDFSTAANNDQSDYENVSDAQTGNPEHTYVKIRCVSLEGITAHGAPLAISVYENEQTKERTDADETPGVYANIITSLPINDDDEDYENSEFLDQVVQEQEDDEPDYVNENG